MTSVSAPRSQLTGTLTRTRPAAAGSGAGSPTASTPPRCPTSPAQAARSVPGATAARSGAA